MPTADTPSFDALDEAAWAAFLASVITHDAETGAAVINRVTLSRTDRRQVGRWAREGVLASFWSADAFLVRHNLHIEFYFGFAERMGRSPWAHGRPPAWYEEDWAHEDWSHEDAS